MSEPSTTLVALAASASAIAFIHTFAPDHWMPFAALARSEGWSRWRLFRVTFASAFGHVGASVILGVLGFSLGWALDAMQWLQGERGTWGLYLLIAFGLVYALWGLRRARHWREVHAHDDGTLHTHTHGHDHHGHRDTAAHPHVRARGPFAVWGMFVILVLGPCEALIPLMFAGARFGTSGVVWTTVAFSVSTMATMIGLAMLAHAGFRMIRLRTLEKHIHTLTGAAISATAVMVLVLGI